MEPTELIAKAVARERTRAGLSLSALAAKAGLAKSTLSQLEAGRGNPSIETLWAIASALAIPFSYLFEVVTPERTLIRAHEGKPVMADATTFSAVLLADCPPTSRRDLYRITLGSGAMRRAEPHPPGTVEHALVCSGRVRLGPLECPEELDSGDYYRYPADVPHGYRALSGVAILLLVMESPH
ncbi:MAG: helix-turn-helix domain-containing protein [Candidatus Competibacterales bacterium]